MSTRIVGEGFDSKTGGFKSLIIDGVKVSVEQVAAEREISVKLEKALQQVASEFYQYTEGFTILWDEIDATLTEIAAIRALPITTNTSQCPNAAHMGEHACTNKSQCWEQCGDLGHSEDHCITVNTEGEQG